MQNVLLKNLLLHIKNILKSFKTMDELVFHSLIRLSNDLGMYI